MKFGIYHPNTSPDIQIIAEGCIRKDRTFSYIEEGCIYIGEEIYVPKREWIYPRGR